MEGWYTADVTLPYIDGNRPSITVPAKNRGCQSLFQIYSTLLVFTSVTHTSPTPSLTASLATLYLN
jgi:hypothetical protein